MELGKLEAVFTANTSRFDRGAAGVQAKVAGLTGVMKSLGSASVALQGPLGGVAGRLQGLSALSSQATSGLGAVGVGMAVVTAATIGLGVALFGLVKQSAEAGGELFDLSQKTGLSVESLSGLSILAQTTGSDIKGLSAALGIFQKNMEAATDASSKQGKTFKALGIDTRDNEMALRQAFIALAKMGEGAHQTAKAMELFGRGGKDVLAIVKETNGSLDDAMVKFRKMGLIISTEAAKAADDFNDALTHLELQLMGITRTVSKDAVPAITAGLQTVSEALKASETNWDSWGMTAAKAILTVETAIGGLANVVSSLDWTNFIPFYGLGKVAGDFTMGATRTADSLMRKFNLSQSVGAGIDLPNIMRPGLGRDTDTNKAKGGGRTSEDAGLQLLKQLTRQYAELSTKTELERINLQLLEKQYASINPEIAAQIRVQAELLDVRKASDDVTKELKKRQEEESRVIKSVIDRVVQLKTAISDLVTGMPAWKREALDFIEAKREEGHAWEDNTDKVYLARSAYLAVLESMKAVNDARLSDASDLAGKFRKGDEDAAEKIARGLADAREMAAEIMQDQIDRIRDQMQQLGGDITSIFRDSVGDGFSQGVDQGLLTLGQGLLRIVEDVFLKRLATGLGDILSGLATGGGGSWWKTLLGFVGPALGGGIGGGGGNLPISNAFKPFAKGGIVPGVDRGFDSVPAMLRPGEMVLTRDQQSGIGGGTTIVNNWYLPPDKSGSSRSQRMSRRQQAEYVAGILQSQLT